MRYRAIHEPTRIVYLIGTKWRTRVCNTLAKDTDGWVLDLCMSTMFYPLRQPWHLLRDT